MLRRFLIVFRYFSSKDFNLVFCKSIPPESTMVVRLDKDAVGTLLSRIIGRRGLSFRLVIEDAFDDDRLIIDLLGSLVWA